LNKAGHARLSLVVAMAENNAIGNNGTLPWHLPADLKHFKQLTMGKPIIMGRRTSEAIGRALPGRRNIVLSRDPDFRAEGCETFPSLEGAIDAVASVGTEIMVIGGARMYAQALPCATRIYLTRVHFSFEADTFFPPFNEAEWMETKHEAHPVNQDNSYSYSFIELERC
jgi:dihydrofolate reductase